MQELELRSIHEARERHTRAAVSAWDHADEIEQMSRPVARPVATLLGRAASAMEAGQPGDALNDLQKVSEQLVHSFEVSGRREHAI